MSKITEALNLADSATEDEVLGALNRLKKEAQPVERSLSEREKRINARIVPGVSRAIATEAVDNEMAEEAARAKKAEKQTR